MNLQEFFDYKNTLIEDLLTDERIVSLIDEKVKLEGASILAYHNVFPFEYLPETTENAQTYICCDVDIQTGGNKTFLSPVLYIWVFTHKSLLRVPGGGVRTDLLCSAICSKINGSRRYGMGELYLYSVKRFAPMTDFNGKVMTFCAKDTNNLFDPKKYTPANRRLG